MTKLECVGIVVNPGALESLLCGLKSRHYSLLAMPDFILLVPLGFSFIMLSMGITSAHGL